MGVSGGSVKFVDDHGVEVELLPGLDIEGYYKSEAEGVENGDEFLRLLRVIDQER